MSEPSVEEVEAAAEAWDCHEHALDHRYSDIEFKDEEGDRFGDDPDHVLVELIDVGYRRESCRILRRSIGPWEQAVLSDGGQTITGWEPRGGWPADPFHDEPATGVPS